eukprot:5388131-Pyramimonas_sp.AAC.1
MGFIDDLWVCTLTEGERQHAYNSVIQVLTDLWFEVNQEMQSRFEPGSLDPCCSCLLGSGVS